MSKFYVNQGFIRNLSQCLTIQQCEKEDLPAMDIKIYPQMQKYIILFIYGYPRYSYASFSDETERGVEWDKICSILKEENE